MKTEAGRHLGTDLSAPPAIAVCVESWRVHGDAELAIDDGHYPAGDTALRRDSYAVSPLARVVVHAAGEHDREHASIAIPKVSGFEIDWMVKG